MDEPYLKIGDVARKVGVSPSVIRSWESLGLARPRRTESKYRLYTAEDVKLLKRARFLRKVRGLNAAAIVQLLKREGKVHAADAPIQDSPTTGSPKAKPPLCVPRLRFSSKVHPSGFLCLCPAAQDHTLRITLEGDILFAGRFFSP